MHTSARATVPKAPPIATPAATAPSVVAPAIHKQTFNQNYLADVRIDHGPQQLLSRLFLRGDTLLRERGINLKFAPLDELLAVNRRNSDSWRPLLPIFDAEECGFNDDNGFCLLAYTSSGQCVAAQAARLYDLTGTSFKDEVENLRLFYPDPEAQRHPGERIVVTAPMASAVTGPTVFSGAVWYHPSMRKQGLTTILPRVTKALSQTRWDPEVTLSFMAEEVVKQGTAPRAGYYHVDWSIDLIDTPVSAGTVHSAMIWSNRDELYDYFSGLLPLRDPQVDTVVHHRSA
jgi:hypothetical protein